MFSAVATVGDSLMTIKKLCFDDKTVSTRELYDALQANWKGYELLRQRILNEVPFYAMIMMSLIPGSVVHHSLGRLFQLKAGVNNGTNNCGALDLYWVGAEKEPGPHRTQKNSDPLSPSSDPRQDAVKNGL
jgi:formate C-acetyltransferase